mgnify:CR=1 FL=1
MTILAVTFCRDVSKLQIRLAEFKMFKGVVYSDDGTKSSGLLEIFDHLFFGIKDENDNLIAPPLLSVINQNESIIEVFSYGTKYKDNPFDTLTPEQIADIRLCYPEQEISKDDEGNDVVTNRPITFKSLA